MKREEYLQQLQTYLKKLPEEDYIDAIEYFTEYFDDAGVEHEQAVIAELGTPKQAASELLNQLLEKEQQRPLQPRTVKRTVWLTVLAIFAAPIGIPVALTAILLLFAAVLVLFSLLLAFLAVIVAVFFVSGKLLLRGIVALPFSFAGGVSLLGLGGMLLGIYLLLLPLIPGCWQLMKKGFLASVTWFTNRKRGL